MSTLSAAPDPSPPAARMDRRVLAAIVAALAVTAVGVTMLLVDRKPRSTNAMPGLTVEGSKVLLAPGAPQWDYLVLSSAEAGPPLEPLPVPGRVVFDENRTASVGSPLEGRVEQVVVRFGDRAKKGQRLFSVRSAAFADLDRELSSAHDAVAVKQRLLERVADLARVQAAPEKDRLAAEAELKEAQLAFKAAQAKRSSLGVEVVGDNLFWVIAPRDGTVVEHDIFANEEVGPSREKPLLRLSDLDEVLVLGDLAERDALDLRPGGEAVVVSGANTRHGTVERVSEVVDPSRHTVEVRIRLKNADRALRPNAFVEVTPDIDAAARYVRTPTDAVVTEGEQAVVFVQAAGALLRTPVTLGRTRGEFVEVRSGLDAGTRYVSKGALLLLNQVDLAR